MQKLYSNLRLVRKCYSENGWYTNNSEKNMSYVCAIITFFLTGCSETQNYHDSDYIPVMNNINITENRDPHFFAVNHNFDFPHNTLIQIENLLKNSKANGIDNVGFSIISDQTIPVETQQKIKNKIFPLMNKAGFISSRIVDYGTSVYDGATRGIIINILKYDLERSDCSKWSEGVGDIDSKKNLPKMGVTNNYNLEEMIANKADLIAPRKYIGQKTDKAVAAVNSDSSGGGSSSSSDSGSSSSGIKI
jgi:type IV pilus biogenesis protein CpaD/CtpE